MQRSPETCLKLLTQLACNTTGRDYLRSCSSSVPPNPLKPIVVAPLAASGLEFCIYEFCVILSVICDYFLKQCYQVDLCNGEVWCSL
jgi:hypothetical protein